MGLKKRGQIYGYAKSWDCRKNTGRVVLSHESLRVRRRGRCQLSMTTRLKMTKESRWLRKGEFGKFTRVTFTNNLPNRVSFESKVFTQGAWRAIAISDTGANVDGPAISNGDTSWRGVCFAWKPQLALAIRCDPPLPLAIQALTWTVPLAIQVLTWTVPPLAMAIQADVKYLARSIGNIGCRLGQEVAQRSEVTCHACFSPFPMTRDWCSFDSPFLVARLVQIPLNSEPSWCFLCLETFYWVPKEKKEESVFQVSKSIIHNSIYLK